jgi:hypothetical protein
LTVWASGPQRAIGFVSFVMTSLQTGQRQTPEQVLMGKSIDERDPHHKDAKAQKQSLVFLCALVVNDLSPLAAAPASPSRSTTADILQ